MALTAARNLQPSLTSSERWKHAINLCSHFISYFTAALSPIDAWIWAAPVASHCFHIPQHSQSRIVARLEEPVSIQSSVFISVCLNVNSSLFWKERIFAFTINKNIRFYSKHSQTLNGDEKSSVRFWFTTAVAPSYVHTTLKANVYVTAYAITVNVIT